MENLSRLLLEPLALATKFVGAATVTVSVGYALLPYLRMVLPDSRPPALHEVRSRLGSGLVLGLEFLIGAAMLRLLLTPTLSVVMILGGLVLLRTVLVVSIGLESRWTEQGGLPGPLAPAIWRGNGRAV